MKLVKSKQKISTHSTSQQVAGQNLSRESVHLVPSESDDEN